MTTSHSIDGSGFPLGFFNAGLQADLVNRILWLAKTRNLPLDQLEVQLRNGYRMTGAFFRGDGKGYAEPAKVRVAIQSGAPAGVVADLISAAVKASPALSAMRIPVDNTFALYVNGKRRAVTTMKSSTAADAPDPLKTYSTAPAPLTGQARASINGGQTETLPACPALGSARVEPRSSPPCSFR